MDFSVSAWCCISPHKSPAVWRISLALIFAALAWPLVAGLTRLTVAGAGGWFAYQATQNVGYVFGALACALTVFGLIIATAVARGAWGAPRRV